jgi:DNA repair protein RecN (Recombination protein N)
MLRELEVRDLGIIERVRLELPGGFVVLTGETGAGKSLLVQSLQLLAGERADSEQVRSGSDRLVVEGVFEVPQSREALDALEALGVAADDELIARREVSSQGRSRAWLNDTPVTVGALQRLAPFLLSIHGQHEQRGLTDPATHLELVDLAGGLNELRTAVGVAFVAWQGVRQRLAEERRTLAARRDRLDTISFQIREIEEARLEDDEEERLREERAMLGHAERIAELLAVAQEALADPGGSAALARAARAATELVSLGLSLQEPADELAQAGLLAEDAERQLAGLADRVHADPQRLEAVEARLALIERLARKYGGSVGAVLGRRAALLAERDHLDSLEDRIAELEAEEAGLLESFLLSARDLSRRRESAAAAFAHDIVAVLARLGMPKVELALRLDRRRVGQPAVESGGEVLVPAADGIDEGEFVISPNPGEAPRPMAKIASGGELSRLHLAIRTVLRLRGSRDDRLTLLFDEVDAGIGGRVAEELGELLSGLGEQDQVMVVTHLPQVAGRASAHFVVGKRSRAGRTTTAVERVEGAARIEEIVRMLGPTTEAARRHARELLGVG